MYYILLSVSVVSCLLTYVSPDRFRPPLMVLAFGCILLAVFLLPTIWGPKSDEVIRKIPLRDAKGKFIKRK